MALELVPAKLAFCPTVHWLYCLLSLYDEPISFGTEMYLSRAKTVTVCSLSYSWWERPDVPDVIRPELPAGRSGPVWVMTDVFLSGPGHD